MNLGILTPPSKSLGLNMVAPINWLHPLNRGLVAWWLTVPGLASGSRLQDLTQQYPGSFVNAPFWSGYIGRPGGAGCVDFTGSTSDYVSVPSSLVGTLSVADGITFACWFRPTTSLTAYQAIIDSTTGGSFNRQLSVFLGGSATAVYVAFATSLGASVAGLTTTLVLNTWQHIAVTAVTGRVRVYINGKEVGTTTSGVGSGFAAAELQIGANPSTGGANYAGQQDDIRIFKRVLSAWEIAEVYQNSRSGYIGTLNRVSVIQCGGAAAAGLGIPIAAYHYNHHLHSMAG